MYFLDVSVPAGENKSKLKMVKTTKLCNKQLIKRLVSVGWWSEIRTFSKWNSRWRYGSWEDDQIAWPHQGVQTTRHSATYPLDYVAAVADNSRKGWSMSAPQKTFDCFSCSLREISISSGVHYRLRLDRNTNTTRSFLSSRCYDLSCNDSFFFLPYVHNTTATTTTTSFHFFTR